MARSFNAANPDYIYRAAPVTGAPFTISVHGNTIDVPTNRVIAGLFDTATDNNSFLLYQGVFGIQYFIQAGGLDQTGAVDVGTGLWFRACVIEVASNDHRLYGNGELKTNGTNIIPDSIDRYALGIRADATPDLGYNGLIAEAALWNVALTEAEALELNAGYCPLLIRPESLVSYLPLIRDNDADLIDGVIWTASGSPTIAAHPPVFYPTSAF